MYFNVNILRQKNFLSADFPIEEKPWLTPRKEYFKVEGFVEPFWWEDADIDLVEQQELCWKSCFGNSNLFNIRQCSHYGECSIGVFQAVSIKDKKGNN
jgi:hypothetical protein